MWYHKTQIVDSIDPQYKAFVYLITNLISGKQYIGLKQFYCTKYKVIKGKKKRINVESDWKDYWSSSDQLKSDVKLLGEENFRREILHFCKMKSHANYLEMREQIDRRVLENPDLYYNRIINARVSYSHISKLIDEINLLTETTS